MSFKAFNFKGFPDLYSANQLNGKSLNDFFRLAKKMKKTSDKKKAGLLKQKILGSLFFEPSTRTRLSFESSALKLGMNCLGFTGTKNTSIAKGETLSDTILMASNYADCLVIRTPFQGSAKYASLFSSVPVINAGDGSREHPTQALMDFFTIKEEFVSLKGLEVCFAGDLLHARTFHSLARILAKQKTIISFYPVEGLNPPIKLVEEIAMQTKIKRYNSLEKAVSADVLYLTRVQEERFDSIEQAKQTKKNYVLKPMLLRKNPFLKVMAPLPRMQELPVEIDATKANLYFKQALNAIPSRQALLYSVLSKKKFKKPVLSYAFPECNNRKCIIFMERNSCNSKKCFCSYCESWF